MNASPLQIELAAATIPSTHLIARWSGSFADAVATVRQVIVDERFLVLHAIDTQHILAASDVAIGPLQQLLFFHPIYMVQLLATDPAAIVDVPLKAVVTETRSGVEIRILDPASRMSAYPGLEALAADLSAACGRIISRVARHEAA